MSTPRQGGALGDELANLGIIALIAAAVLAVILRVAGTITAWVTGIGAAAGRDRSRPRRALHPSDPGSALAADEPEPGRVLGSSPASSSSRSGVGWWVWRFFREHARQTKVDPYRIVGIATRTDVTTAASEKALLRRAGQLRPSIQQPAVTDVGYLLGASRNVNVWASVEDSILLIGPPRSGKGLHVVINAILDAPGAVVTTSTRPDNLTATLTARRAEGRPVAVFDPQHLAEGVPAGLRWSPIRGCKDPLTAMIRATGLAAGTGLSAGGVEGGDFWEGKTRTALQALLHAAALDQRAPAELFRWTLDPAAASDAVAILTANPRAATGWADSLQAMIDSDPRTRDSIWQGVSLSLAALADPRVLDAVSPGPEERFDPEEFRASAAPCICSRQAPGRTTVPHWCQRSWDPSKPPVASPHAHRQHVSTRRCCWRWMRSETRPTAIAPDVDGRRRRYGITTMPVLQSPHRHAKWSDNAAGAIWDASIVKIILGGASNSRDLQDLTTLIGERDEITDSTTIGDHGSAPHNAHPPGSVSLPT